MGLFEDTNIDTDQFSYLALAFYVTYLFFEIPTGYLMQRLPTAKYLGANRGFTPETFLVILKLNSNDDKSYIMGTDGDA